MTLHFQVGDLPEVTTGAGLSGRLRSHWRRSSAGVRGIRPNSRLLRHAGSTIRAAELIRGELRRRSADFIPLAELPAALSTEVILRAAIAQSRDLGIGGPIRKRVVWRADPAALAAGFEPVCDGERLTLQLAGSNPTQGPLLLGGSHLDPNPPVGLDLYPDPTAASAYGTLGRALARLADMSARWLTEGHDLYALIARAWKADAASLWSRDRLQIYCVALGERIATQFWRDNAPASRLELVVWKEEDDGLSLVNVYPCATDHTIFEREDRPQ